VNFPQIWARGQSGDFIAWRSSLKSLAEAQAWANQAAQQLADRFRTGNLPKQHRGYYPDRPFREQILQEIRGESGEVTALITRNSYGCKVLNTAQVMFVDVDLPQPKPAGGFWKRLFGKAAAPLPDESSGPALSRIEAWTREHSEWGWRIYRTHSGLRLLATHAPVQPESEQAREAFQELGADPLYQALCKTQKCFRARLTPKPWRCGVHAKPARWPWLDPKQQQRFEKWEAEYRARSAAWATCTLLTQMGSRGVHPEVQRVIELHDEPTRVDSKLALA
jgi:hypothetical protein